MTTSPTQPYKISSSKLAELLAKARKKVNAVSDDEANAIVQNAIAAENDIIGSFATGSFAPDLPGQNVTAIANAISTIPSPRLTIGRDGKPITLNSEQRAFVDLALQGQSCILIGAAGTGKTTSTNESVQEMIHQNVCGLLSSDGHNYLTSATPGIVSIAYTRRAVSNLRRAMPPDMKGNTLTIHKLLEYQPVYYSVFDSESGKEVSKMSFEPTRNALKPLPSSIKTIYIDESSMVSVELFQEIIDACPHNPQFIFLGDIQQLPPVFGSAILGFKMLELPTIELTQVYRQALESPIIRLAHRILSGNPINKSEFSDWKIPGQLTIHPWKKKLEAEVACNTAGVFFSAAYDQGQFDPESDIILLPFNKSFGTIELNRKIANHIARSLKRVTYEIIAGFNKHYFSPGDKILVEKEDAIITRIEPNVAYAGMPFQLPSEHLNYWGHNSSKKVLTAMSDDDVDSFLESMTGGTSDDDKEKVRQCSHIIYYKRMNIAGDELENEIELKVSSAADVNNILLGYVLTVHKSQGSEWKKVFLVLHQSHATMLQRELLYTAVTRAKEELYVICEPESFDKGIRSQRIKGNTLAEKISYFQGKKDNGYLEDKLLEEA